MASRLSWLAQLKGDQLRSLAAAIGINSSGTKPNLISALQTRLPRSVFGPENEAFTRRRPNPEERDLGLELQSKSSILSIDMGIRNLAYCRILPPSLDDRGKIPKPVVTDWTRNDISTPSDTAKETNSGHLGAADFEPDIYAAHAYTLLAPLVKQMPPSHILIERQRFRSMGGVAVQEWTLRVNMFESMLYAVLETLKREGLWQGSVVGVSPARVVRHWISATAMAAPETDLHSSEMVKTKALRRPIESISAKKTKKSSAKTKAMKQRVVGDWLEKEEMVELQGQAARSKTGYLKRLNKLRGREGGVAFGKLDDLADCLLQGMAWLKWEENRRLIWEKGEAALVELENG